MLIRLLELLKSGKTYTIQELAELADMDAASVKAEIEYLEHTGYIKPGAIQKEETKNTTLAIITAKDVMGAADSTACYEPRKLKFLLQSSAAEFALFTVLHYTCRMREFMSRALQKLPRMNDSQLRSFIQLIADDYALFDAMMDSLTSGVIILDSDHTIIKTNRAALRILGIPLSESPERPLWASIPDTKLADFIHTVIKNEETCTAEEFVIVADEGNHYIELSVLPLVKEKRVRGTIITVEDITQRKREEINNRRLENLASLTNLAAAVAHEIKNPLAAISIHVQLLRKNFKACNLEINAKAQKHLDVVEEEIERLNKIVVDFLFAVRPLQCEFAPVDVNELIKNLFATFQEEFSAAGISFVPQLDGELPIIQADERFLRQALMNILTNAKAAMMPAGGELGITTRYDEENVYIAITDTGKGIPPDILHKIFEPYFTTKPDGSGLGLTMTYKVIKEHGGDIQVHSEIGKGTRFTLILPITHSERPLLLEAHTAYDNSTKPQFESIKDEI